METNGIRMKLIAVVAVVAVVVEVGGEDIENHSPRHFADVLQRCLELDHESEEVAVVERIGRLVQKPGGGVEMHAPQRLVLHEVEARHEQMRPR